MTDRKMLLVGDNPFHGVSHLSQERASSRDKDLASPDYAAELVQASVENGADGFMFTVSELTLSMVRILSKAERKRRLLLYALVPNVNEFIRTATGAGGLPGLARKMAKEIAFSVNLKAVWNGARGIVAADPAAVFRSYLAYEVCRLRSPCGKGATLASVLLHELATDTALALNMDWLFKTHVDFVRSLGMKPGFETRNFSYLVKRFEEWGIDTGGIAIAAPFNLIGFQMCPSREEWERSLPKLPEAEVIAFSILAAGYLGLPQAIEHISTLPNVKGIAVGVSKRQHAIETFRALRERFPGDSRFPGYYG